MNSIKLLNYEKNSDYSMRIYLLMFLFSICSTIFLFAQTEFWDEYLVNPNNNGLQRITPTQVDKYIPLVNEDYVWSYCDIVKKGSEEYDLHYSQFQFGGDTIINSITYKKLYHRDCSSNKLFYTASLREDAKKVYAFYKDESQEKLIYDFGLSVGDSILSPFNTTNFYKVIKTDSIDIAGGRCKRIELDFDTWIEGVGTLNRFMIYPLQALPLHELGIRINYQKKGAEMRYQTKEWYFSNNDCGTSSVKPTEQSQKGIYFVTPGQLLIT